MSELVSDCPRCGSQKITFDLIQQQQIAIKYEWQRWFEVFCVCRHCQRSTVFVVSQKDLDHESIFEKVPLFKTNAAANTLVTVEGFISHKDSAAAPPPEHLPPEIEAAFREGATCMATGCFNAGATMFRLCVDHATRALLPSDSVHGLTANIRRSLGLRVVWLFENSILPAGLKELSTCIKEDGNDGAHTGTLKKEDAEDIKDFTFELLERLYTEPQRLILAKERREARRKP